MGIFVHLLLYSLYSHILARKKIGAITIWNSK